MSAPKNINRKTFLTTTVTGIAALSFGGCSGEGDDPVDGSGGASTGGASTGGTSTGGASSGGASTGGASSGGASTGGDSGDGGSASGGASTGGASTGGATGDGGSTSGGASSGGGTGDGGAEGSGGAPETGGAGGSEEYMCTSETDNGTHSHPLTVPGSDVDRGYQEEPYLLEDGGTGHTHTLLLSAYDFLYLSAGATVEVNSSEDNGHNHPCVISCTLG